MIEPTQQNFLEWAKAHPEADIYYNYNTCDKASILKFSGVLEDYQLSKNGLFSLKNIVLKWLESKEQPKKWEELESGDTLTLVEELKEAWLVNPHSLSFYKRNDGKTVKVHTLIDVPLFPRVITLENCHQSQHFYPHMFKEFQEEPIIENPEFFKTKLKPEDSKTTGTAKNCIYFQHCGRAEQPKFGISEFSKPKPYKLDPEGLSKALSKDKETEIRKDVRDWFETKEIIEFNKDNDRFKHNLKKIYEGIFPENKPDLSEAMDILRADFPENKPEIRYSPKDIERICELRNIIAGRKARTAKFDKHIQSGERWIEAINRFNKEFQEQPIPEEPQSIYTQEYIDNTSHFMCDEPIKGWGLTKIGWLECVLYSKDVRTKPDFPFEVLEPVNGLCGFEKFTLTNPNKPKEQEIMDAENKTDLSEAMEIVIAELSKDKEEGSYYHGWQSNIAMAVYDSLPKGLTEYFYDSINKCCNAGAKEFLDRLIGQPELPKVETKEQEYKPFVKLTEEQQDYFYFRRFRLQVSPRYSFSMRQINFDFVNFADVDGKKITLKECFEKLEYYSPEEKAWVKFGEKVES